MLHVTRPFIRWPQQTESNPSTTTAMKRAVVPSDVVEGTRKRVRRQEPVSCETCRRKKLKCNRQQPCSSCVTRRLACIYGSSEGSHRTERESEQYSQSPPIELGNPSKRQDAFNSLPSQAPDSQPLRYNRESQMTADWLETIHMGDRVPTATPKSLRDELDELRNNEKSFPSDTLLPISGRSWTASQENPATISLLSYLPKEHEAIALFRYYTDFIDYMYHIIFPKKVEQQIHGVYRAIERKHPPDLNHMALLFSIAASSLYLQLSIESSIYAGICSREFSFLTGAALIQSYYSVNPTISGIQAATIIVHHASNMSCHPSVSALFSQGALVSQAKNLKLHCTDSPRYRDLKGISSVDAVELETRRRLWWDIASYDWFLGFLSGPQEWTYMVNPEHMKVELPLNVDDGMVDGSNRLSRPSSSPTDMSFFLERLKLGIVCREVIDATSYEHLKGLEVSYDKILKLDNKFRQALSEIPEFFRLDPTSRRRFASLYQKRPTLAWQRCLLQQGYFSRLCRLHRHYFIRGAREPVFSYSHIVCLQSARKVLAIKRIMDEDEPRFNPPSSVVWSVMHHVFMAAVILLLDVCFNWDDILAEKRKEEVLEACRMLSNAQQSSSLVKEGINAMMGVLQKHWQHGRLTTATGQQTQSLLQLNTEAVSLREPPHPALSSPETVPNSSTIKQDMPTDFPSNATGVDELQLEDIWSEMLDNSGNFAIEDTDWTGLLSELTNATLPYG